MMELLLGLLRLGTQVLTLVAAALVTRILYMQTLHPLAKFPGPWYATSFSIFGALVSIKQKEPQFFTYLVKKYGSESSTHILAP